MTSQAERWLTAFEALAGNDLDFEDYVAAWRCYRDGLTPVEAVATIQRETSVEGATDV